MVVPARSTVLRASLRTLKSTPASRCLRRAAAAAHRRGRSDGTISAADFERLLTRHGDAVEPDSFLQLLQFCGLEAATPADRIAYASVIDTLTSAAKVAHS